MGRMWLRLILLCNLYFIGNVLLGQSNEGIRALPAETKNVVYGTFGTAFPVGFYGAINGCYERRVFKSQSKFPGTLWVRVGYGKWAAWLAGGTHFVTGITALTFHGSSHLEINIGFTSIFDKDRYEFVLSQSQYIGDPKPDKSRYRYSLPAGAIGYRFQKPGTFLVFRIGIAFPETAYASLGFSF